MTSIISAILLLSSAASVSYAQGPETMDMCTFCPDGVADPAFVIPSGDNATCADAAGYAPTLDSASAECSQVKLAEALCCPPPEEAQAAVVETTVPTTAPPPPPTMCSCSPTVITFVLALNQTCSDNDIEDNSGVQGTYCFTETGVAPPEPPASPNATEPDDAMEPVRERQLQDDPVVEVVSVEFLEFDTNGDLFVINQDGTYIDVSLTDGDRIKFNSASSFLDTSLPLEDQMSGPALVPGGASLIIYGKTASGTVVRNRFLWLYDMNCGRDNAPVNVGDEIGWVKVVSVVILVIFSLCAETAQLSMLVTPLMHLFSSCAIAPAAGIGYMHQLQQDEVSNAWPAFCPALPAGSPTISPRTNEPTLTPSKTPTLKPTQMSMIPVVPTAPPMGPTPVFGTKSSKVPKTLKPGKSGKSSSKSSKSTKSNKSSKSSDVQGKASKHEELGYGKERFTAWDAERSNGAVSMSGIVSLVSSLLLASALFAGL